MTKTILVAGVVAANPGPGVHLAALGIVVLVALVACVVVRWRRRREQTAAEKSDAHDA